MTLQPDQRFTTDSYGDHPSQFVERWQPEGQTNIGAPNAVLLHGGYWRDPYGCDLMHPMAADLVARGWTVDNVEYRRVGQTDDPWLTMASDLTQVIAASAANSVVIGHSAGGHLALWAAAQPSCPTLRGVVALAPLANLETADRLELSSHATRDLFGSDPTQRKARIIPASPHRLVPLGCRQLIVHGDADVNVPQEISADYVAKARNAGDPVTYHDPVGVDHFDIIDPTTPVWSRTMDTIETWTSR